MQSACMVSVQMESRTHVRLDILVLEVERVLPDINTDEGDVG